MISNFLFLAKKRTNRCCGLSKPIMSYRLHVTRTFITRMNKAINNYQKKIPFDISNHKSAINKIIDKFKTDTDETDMESCDELSSSDKVLVNFTSPFIAKNNGIQMNRLMQHEVNMTKKIIKEMDQHLLKIDRYVSSVEFLSKNQLDTINSTTGKYVKNITKLRIEFDPYDN